MRRLSLDSETYLLAPGIAAPRMVCLTTCDEDGDTGLLLRDDAVPLLHDLFDAPDIEFVLHHARFDMAVFAAADARLLPKIARLYDEGRVRCTMVREKLLALARGELADEGETGAKRNVRFSLAACILRRFNIDLSADKATVTTDTAGKVKIVGDADSWRLRYSELDGVPVERWPTKARDYAIDDSRWNLALFDAQTVELNEEGAPGDVIPDEAAQTRAAFWLYLMSVRGVRTDPVGVNRLATVTRAEYERMNAIIRAADVLRPKMEKGEMVWAKNMAALRERVSFAYRGNPPMTAGGTKERKNGTTAPPAVATDRDTLTSIADPTVMQWIEETEEGIVDARKEGGLPDFTPEEMGEVAQSVSAAAGAHFGVDPAIVYNWLVLHAVGERSGVEKVLKTYVPVLYQGTQGPICPKFNELVASGRGSCVAKGTMIEVVRNTSTHPIGIPVEDVRAGDFVYAFGEDGLLQVCPVTWAGKTGHKPVVRLHWTATGRHGGRGYVDLTEDHLVRVLGGWRKVGDILPGDRVYAMRRGVRKGYWHLYCTGQREYREHVFLWQMFNPYAEHVHHRDSNKLNNEPSNLLGLTQREHHRIHATGRVVSKAEREGSRARLKRLWQEHPERMIKYRVDVPREVVANALWSTLGKPTEAARLLGIDYSTLCRLLKKYGIRYEDIAAEFNAHGERIDESFVSRWRESFVDTIDRKPYRQLLPKVGLNWYSWRRAQEKFGHVPYNHEIVRVERLLDPVDVYDLTVEGAHNFIANEICVHNCYEPNLQNPPRKGGIRECFVPRPGYVYALCDYSFVELVTLAQTCLDLFGWSTLATSINNGLDPHLDMAASDLGISYAEAERRLKAGDPEVADQRQRSKVRNFGFPGGLGAATYVAYARGYGLTLTEREAKQEKEKWFSKWPEMRSYYDHHGRLTLGDRLCNIVQLPTGRVRGQIGFTASCNTHFQGRAADGIKRAGWYATKECYLHDPYPDGVRYDPSSLPVVARLRAGIAGRSPLFGSYPVLFLHDELILETPEDRAADAVKRLSDVMVEGMREVVPDVIVKTEAALCRRWYKGAKPVFDAAGRMIPWEPKKKA